MAEANSPRVVIVQHEHGGHRLIYVRHLLRSPSVGARPALVLTPEAVASWEFREHLQQSVAESKAEVHLVGEGATFEDSIREGLAVAERDGGLLVAPDADLMLRSLLKTDRSTRARVQLRYLVMRTPMGSTRDRLVAASKYGLAALIALRWKRARGFFLTDTFGVVKRSALAGLLEPLPDPSPALPSSSREKARRSLGVSDEGFIYGVLGTVTEGKNPDVALAALELLPEGYRLLLAGQLSPGVRTFVAELDPSIRERVVLLDRHLSDEELGWAVSACDAVLLLHDFDGSSGMLLNAAAAGVPVVVGESPWLRRVARHEHLGVIAQHQAGSVAAAVEQLRRAPMVVQARPEASDEAFAHELLGP